MTVFEIHDEGGFAAAKAFLEGWLPKVDAHLSRLLGLPNRPDAVHVFLSDRKTHELRFPRREQELLLNAGGDQPVQDIPIRTETYAHGVAHLTSSSLNLPPGIPDGESAIFLDCETLGGIANELKLDYEPVLGRTTIHELSHIVRGHVSADGARTHGFAREGDAQRDAWAVTGSMLTSPDTRATALAGRAAQVRLADRQPRAYTMFGNDSADRYHWHHEDPEAAVLLVRTPRNLLAVLKEDIVEVPVRTLGSPVPEVGDLIYLAEEREDRDYFVAGPWVVLNRVDEAVSLSKRDRDEVAKIERDRHPSYGARTDVQYVVLRPFRELRAAPAVSTDDLPAIGIPYAVGEPGAWLDRLVSPADPVFEQIRDERRAADAAFFDDAGDAVREKLLESGYVYDPDAG